MLLNKIKVNLVATNCTHCGLCTSDWLYHFLRAMIEDDAEGGTADVRELDAVSEMSLKSSICEDILQNITDKFSIIDTEIHAIP